MADTIITKISVLEERIIELASFTARCEEVAEEMAATMVQLGMHWKGETFEANVEFHKVWEKDHEDMVENLSYLRHGVRVAKMNAEKVQAIHKNMWPAI